MISNSTIFEREEELEQLRKRFLIRRSFLFHGPVGVGKTLLLRQVVSEFTDVLYSPQNPTSQSLYRNLAVSLLELEQPVLVKSCPQGRESLQEKTVISLKGLVRDALHDSKYLVIMDHLVQPSQALAASIRELMLNCSVPVIAVSRSAHMEDAGFVLPLLPDRSERFSLQNFDSGPARRFAVVSAEREGVTAKNIEQFLARVVEFTDGNPGAVLQMIRLAKAPKYLHESQIKIAPLFIDYRIAMVSQ